MMRKKCREISCMSKVDALNFEVGSGKWEVGSGKWEVGSGKWEVGSRSSAFVLIGPGEGK